MQPQERLAGLVAGLGLLAVLLVPSGSVAQERDVLTLEQAVREALVRNDRIINQGDAIEQADLSIQLARNAFHPKVVPNVLGSFGQTDVSNQVYRVDLSQRFVTGTEFRVGVGSSTAQIPSTVAGDPAGDIRFYNADTTLAVSQPILRGFGRSVARRSLTTAEAQRDESSRQKMLTEQYVALDVAATYYRLVTQQAMVGVAQKSVDRARSLRDASEAKLDAGLVSQLDVFRAQQLVSQAQIQLFDAQGAAEDARDQLCFLIGREPGVLFDVVADIPNVDDPLPLDQAIARALAGRIDLASAVAGAAEAQRSMAYSRNQLLPQFDLNLALTRRETAPSFTRSFGLNRFHFATFFTISMPVDRTPQLIDYQNAVIERDRRNREIEVLRSRIADDVRRAARNRDRLVRILAAAEASVDIGNREVEVARLRYERGLSNNLDVVSAETNLLAAESRRVSALAELAVARLGFRATIGAFDPRRDLGTVPAGAAGQ
jgi:outer membrane protein TolC